MVRGRLYGNNSKINAINIDGVGVSLITKSLCSTLQSIDFDLYYFTPSFKVENQEDSSTGYTLIDHSYIRDTFHLKMKQYSFPSEMKDIISLRNVMQCNYHYFEILDPNYHTNDAFLADLMPTLATVLNPVDYSGFSQYIFDVVIDSFDAKPESPYRIVEMDLSKRLINKKLL